ncbi:MAG: cytochrome c biogenesis protein CcsA [Alphaproteobacteria bacterium]|nr:cytochrome c biogenesis protein CcsA [Alphaproteobacteria bacterium]
MRYFLFFMTCLFLCVSSFGYMAQANKERSALSTAQWKNLPILHDGRLKPLDSFARTTLKQFSGKDRLQDLNAPQWLAEIFFAPEKAISRPVFKVVNAKDYGLPEEKEAKNHLYNYTDISQSLQAKKDILQELKKTPEKNWTLAQKDLFTLYEQYLIYTEILRSLTSLMVLGGSSEIPDQKKLKARLDRQLKKIIQAKGENFENYTKEEKEIAARSFRLHVLQEGGQHNKIARIIPVGSNDRLQWLSPWQITLGDQEPDEQVKTYLEFWQSFLIAYNKNDHAKWNKTNIQAQEFLKDLPDFQFQKLKLEAFYNGWNFYRLSFGLYCLCLFLILLGAFSSQIPHLHPASFTALLTGVTLHGIDIALRIYLLERPPVGTLYESILFVSLICAAGGLYMAHIHKTSIGLLTGALSSILLYLTAHSFSSHDTMSTLVAVLNTNFWLATHVLCITIGYGLCLLTSLMAHLNLALQKFANTGKNLRKSVDEKNIKTMLILSLLFTATGTILGGIWADQSWGRFWGWDPKENGALLIVLWSVWLLHGRLSAHLKEHLYIAGCAFLSVIVVFAWFGVNLLNVGLHSYGFTDGLLWGIGLFTLFEIALISTLALNWFLKRRKHDEKNYS